MKRRPQRPDVFFIRNRRCSASDGREAMPATLPSGAYQVALATCAFRMHIRTPTIDSPPGAVRNGSRAIASDSVPRATTDQGTGRIRRLVSTSCLRTPFHND